MDRDLALRLITAVEGIQKELNGIKHEVQQIYFELQFMRSTIQFK